MSMVTSWSIIEWFLAPIFLSTVLKCTIYNFHSVRIPKQLYNFRPECKIYKFRPLAYRWFQPYDYFNVKCLSLSVANSRLHFSFVCCYCYSTWNVLAFCVYGWLEMQGANEKSHLAVKFQLDEYLIYSQMLAISSC